MADDSTPLPAPQDRADPTPQEEATMQIDDMAIELRRAGWTAQTSYIWRAPNGSLHLGPAGAWRTMKRVESVLDRHDRESGRRRMLARAMRIRVEIEQIFTDCASWNDNARKPEDEPINCDEDGTLRRMADGLDRMLESEAHRG